MSKFELFLPDLQTAEYHSLDLANLNLEKNHSHQIDNYL